MLNEVTHETTGRFAIDDLSAFDIPFKTVSLKTEDDDLLPARFGKGVVRTDTNEVVGRVGPRTDVRGYLERMDTLNDALHDHVDLSEAKVKNNVFYNGGRIHRNIIFPVYHIEPAIGDITQLTLDIYDSVDNTWAWQAILSGHRLWCLNGCTSKDFTIRVYGRHGANNSITYDAVKRVIIRGINDFNHRESEFRSWISRKVTQTDVIKLYKDTLAFAPRKTSNGIVYTNEKRLESLIEAYQIEAQCAGHNLYSVYNGATRWATHSPTKSPDARRQRQSDVAKMQRSKQFTAMVNGIAYG